MLQKHPLITVAIVCKEIDAFADETITNCLQLDYANFEVLVISDHPLQSEYNDERVRVVPSGAVGIARKRNMALDHASADAEYIAYIDSDAYPDVNWLTRALPYFADKTIGAVGGPNLTPPDESFKRRISGYVLSTSVGFGKSSVTQTRAKNQCLEFMPTCNIIIRKKLLSQIRFDEALGTGEDAKLSFDIISRGYKIFFAGDVIVYHHRKRIFLPIMTAFFNYGYFKYNLMRDSHVFSLFYIYPTLFFISIIIGIVLSFVHPAFFMILTGVLSLYFLVCFAGYLRYSKNIVHSIVAVAAGFLCQLSYGYGFLRSFLIRVFFTKSKSALDKKQLKNVVPNDSGQ